MGFPALVDVAALVTYTSLVELGRGALAVLVALGAAGHGGHVHGSGESVGTTLRC